MPESRSFDDPSLDRSLWTRLLATGPSDVVFLTWEWQRAWWNSFGRGELLLTVVERDGRPVAIAPWFADGGMLFLVGSGGSDQLDLIGDVQDPAVVATAIEAASREVAGFVGVRLYHVPDTSPTLSTIPRAARHLGLVAVDEGGIAAPLLRLDSDGHAGREAADRTSLRRHARWFEREGDCRIRHLTTAEEIEPYLDRFFDQHVRRWEQTEAPSLFLDGQQRRFYRRLVVAGSAARWLRFTVVEWNDEMVAAHLGTHYAGRYLWYKPTFEVRLARRSPGEVLLRSLFLAAVDEGASVFDFGIGDEAFKHRFASDVAHVSTVGLYPPEVVDAREGARRGLPAS